MWCDSNESRASNASEVSNARNSSKALRRKPLPKKCVDSKGVAVFCRDDKAVNASMYTGQAIKKGMDALGCTAIDDGGATTSWCQENCADHPPNCPPAMCNCSSVKVMTAEKKKQRSALPLGGDPSTCVAASADAASTDGWCVANCGDADPLCPPELCICSQTAKLPSQPTVAQEAPPEAEPAAWAIPVAPPTWEPQTVHIAPLPEVPAAKPSETPPEAISSGPAIFPGGDAATCTSPEGAAGATTEWCQNNCADVPPNCPSDICVCSAKGDSKKKWPAPKKVKPYDPSTAGTFKPTKDAAPNDGTEAGAATEPAQESAPPKWASGMGEQGIHPGGDPKTCTAVVGQTQSNDVWCVSNCDIANWKEQAPECPANLCTCTDSGNKTAKWTFAQPLPYDPSTVPQYQPPEQSAEDQRGTAPISDPADPAPPFEAPPDMKAAGPALKKGGDPAGCVAALRQSMSSDAWCVQNCGLEGSKICTTDLCKCGAVHTIPQAIHPGGDPKTCTAVEGQLESNDVWCVSNCDVGNWKEQAPECPTSLCQCKDSGDKAANWTFAKPEPEKAPELAVPWDPSTIPMPPSAKPYDPSTAPTYKPNYTPPSADPALFPGGDPASCKAVEGGSANDVWCTTNCADVPPICPTDLCTCSKKGNPKRKWETATTNADGTPKIPPAPQGKAGTSALKPGMDPAFCVAADNQNMANTGWCVQNCGLPAPQTNCDAQLCYCSDVQRVSAIYPGGDPNSCKAIDAAAKDGWCVDNCGAALEHGTSTCPDYLCKCSQPGNPDKAPGSELPKGVKDAPLTSALPKGGDPSSCIALQGKFEPDDPEKPTNDWCVKSCGADPPNCPIEKCFCADENAILTFGGDKGSAGDGPLAMVARVDGQSQAKMTTPMHTAEYMCKEYGVQCTDSAQELKAARRRGRATKRQRAPPRLKEREKK